jgi:hypothetical protein
MSKTLSYEDFLSPLEAEEIDALLSEQDEKLRSLPASFFSRTYLLSSVDGFQPGTKVRQALFVKHQSNQPMEIIRGLFWTALYGKKFKVVHWNLLFDLFLRTIQPNSTSRAILLILRLTATSKDVRDMNSNIDPVRRIVGRTLGDNKEAKENFMKRLEASLGVGRLPQKQVRMENLLSWQTGVYQPRPPKRTQRKKGYDDKGHLPDRTNPIVLPEDNHPWEEKQDVFALLLRQTDQKTRFFGC